MFTRKHIYCVFSFLIAALPVADAGDCHEALQTAASHFAALSVADRDAHDPRPFSSPFSGELSDDWWLQSIGLTSIARIYACQGDIGSASGALQKISTSSRRHVGYVKIVDELAWAGRLSDAERMCHEPESISTSISCLTNVAQSWRIAGNRHEAYRVLRQAVSLVNNSNAAADEREDIRFDLAYAFASLGDIAEAIRFASLGSGPFEEGEMLLSLSLDYDPPANVRKAVQEHVRAILSTMSDADHIDSLRSSLAILSAQDGEYEITFKEVDHITSQSERDYYRSRCMEVGVTSFSLRELECQLGQIEDEVIAVGASTRLATTMYGLGRVHVAMRLLEQAEIGIAQLEGERYIQGARLVSTAYADVGHFAEAIRVCMATNSATPKLAYGVATRMLQQGEVNLFQRFLSDVGEFEGRNAALAALVALQAKSLSFEEAWNSVM